MRKIFRFLLSPNYYFDRADDGCGCIFIVLVGLVLVIAGVFYLLHQF